MNMCLRIILPLIGKYEAIPKIYSKDMVEMVDACLLRDYKKRPSINEILKKSIMTSKAKTLGIEIPDEKGLKEEYETEKQERLARRNSNNLSALKGVQDAVGNVQSQL